MANQEALQRAYDLCVQKTRQNISRMTDDFKQFSHAVDGDYYKSNGEFMNTYNWTSSFFTGMAVLAFETTKDPYFLKQVLKVEDLYEDKIMNHSMETMHDLGFLYSLYSVAIHKAIGGKYHRKIAIKAADELAKRFVVKGNYIRAWGRMNENNTSKDGYAIIDCLMNLPLLLWATEETGNQFYKDIAIKHADTSKGLFVRDDFSVYHAYEFDVQTGKPVVGENFCGYAKESHWARGTTWAIYGYTILYAYTQKTNYLELAINLSHKFVASMGSNLIPAWDFRLPEGETKLCDASAAAIAVCAFQEILKYREDVMIAHYMEKMLDELTGEKWINYDLDCPGILRGAHTGQLSYASFGDYFFMEALAKKLYDVRTYW